MTRSQLLAGTALATTLMLAGGSAWAQMYSTGPGVYLSLEGRYMWSAGDKIKNFLYAGDPGYFDTRCGAGCGEYQPYDTAKTDAGKGWGGKAMLGYRFSNGWDVGLALSGGWLKGKDDSSGFNDNQSVLTDKLKTKLRYGVIDFEAGYNMPAGSGSNVRIFGGVRAASLRQRSEGSIDNIQFFNTHFYDYSGHRRTRFSGIGPRLGANGQLGIGSSGFNVFGGVSGALLYGRYKDHHDWMFTPFPQTFSYNDRNKWKLVPNAEGEIGVGYNFNAGTGSTVGIQVGYRGEGWWGAGPKGSVIGPFAEQHKSGDYIMHGPFVRLVATFGAAPAAPAAVAPPPPPPPQRVNSFIVFFDFDKSNITSQAQATINDAVAAAKAGNSARVTLTGHTDRSGSEQYNMALSLRRAEAVKAAMIKQGIPASAIVVIGKGESQPLVPTADGVREPQNRRVEIVI